MARTVNAGAATVRVFADTDPLQRGLKKAQRQLKAFSASVTKIGMGLIKTGALIVAPIVLALRVYSQFADQMAIVAAVTNATGAAFAALTDKAKELGRTTSFTARQVASAMIELGRAGFTAGEILKSIQPVLNLARATTTELSEATLIASRSLRAFNLDASEMERVVDVLTFTTNNSTQVLTELGEAMKFVAPIAVATGDSIEATAAAIGILADNGIVGTRAGTALARAYKNLTKEAKQNALRKIGVQAADASNNLRPIADIIVDIGNATKNMGSAARLANFEELFGRGAAAALNLAKSGAQMKSFTAELRNAAGEAQRISDAMDDTIGGSFRLFISALEGVAIEIGTVLAPAVSAITRNFTSILGMVSKFVKENKKLILGIPTTGALLIAVGVAFLALGIAANVVAFAFGGLLAIVTAVVTVFGFITSPLVLITAGIIALGVALVKFAGVGVGTARIISDAFGKLFGTVGKVIKAIANALLAGDISLASDILWLSLKVSFLTGTIELLKTWNTFSDKFLTALIDTFFDSKEEAVNFWSDMQSIFINGGQNLLGNLRDVAATWQAVFVRLGAEFKLLSAKAGAESLAIRTQANLEITRIENERDADEAENQSARTVALADNERKRTDALASIDKDAGTDKLDNQLTGLQSALAENIAALKVKLGDAEELGGLDFGEFEDEVKKLVKLLFGGEGGGAIAQAETRGSFSTAAIERAGASTATARAQQAAILSAQNSVAIVKNTKQTASNTAKQATFK